uniref:protein CWC15 homolog isoform X2 n=1 Tax=Pristiophorus japonicus TaxID=55135 RepID=UPI00398EBAE5
MTTAARPTFEPARGGKGKGEGDLSQLSKQYSSRDLPSHTKIKYRQPTQDVPEELRSRDFRRELEERERVVVREKNRDRPPREHTTSSSKRPRLDQIPAANLDADDPLTDEEEEEDSDRDSSSEDDDDDDTAALLAELEKIKKERAEEQARKAFEEAPKIKLELLGARTLRVLTYRPFAAAFHGRFFRSYLRITAEAKLGRWRFSWRCTWAVYSPAVF